MTQRVGVARYWADVWKARTPDFQVRRCRLDQVCLSFAAEPCQFGCDVGADACFEIPDTDGDGARDPD